jgi:hypothetical protein
MDTTISPKTKTSSVPVPDPASERPLPFRRLAVFTSLADGGRPLAPQGS